MSAAKHNTAETRDKLLTATQRIVQTQGIGSLTLDAVARAAGVSKGGLLHHYPSKDTLVEALIKSLLEDFNAHATQRYEQEKPGDGRWLRAYVQATFDDLSPKIDINTLLLAVAENKAVMRLILDDHMLWQTRLMNEGIPTARVQIIKGAADSYWMDHLMAYEPMAAEARDALLKEMLSLIRKD